MSANVELVNLGRREFYSAYLRRSAWDPVRWPLISFDYRFLQPGCGLNLSLLLNGAMTIVTWTHPRDAGQCSGTDRHADPSNLTLRSRSPRGFPESRGVIFQPRAPARGSSEGAECSRSSWVMYRGAARSSTRS